MPRFTMQYERQGYEFATLGEMKPSVVQRVLEHEASVAKAAATDTLPRPMSSFPVFEHRVRPSSRPRSYQFQFFGGTQWKRDEQTGERSPDYEFFNLYIYGDLAARHWQVKHDEISEAYKNMWVEALTWLKVENGCAYCNEQASNHITGLCPEHQAEHVKRTNKFTRGLCKTKHCEFAYEAPCVCQIKVQCDEHHVSKCVGSHD